MAEAAEKVEIEEEVELDTDTGAEDTGEALSVRETLEAAYDDDQDSQDDKEPDTGEPKHEVQEELSDQAKEKEAEAGGEGKDAESERPRAPNSWKADVRESWKELPAPVQDEIVRREREHDTLMQENAQNRGIAQEYQAVVAPFMNNIRAEGVTPAVALENLLQTASQLQMGSTLTKAQTIVRLIGAYGVDIQTLSDVLTDSHTPTEEDRIASEVEKRMQPYQQQLNQQQQLGQQEQQQYTANVRAETDVWAKDAEFVKEVGGLMADLLDGAGKRAESLTLDEAYTQACKIHPTVSKIVAQREAAAAAKTNIETNKGKRRAGKSVTGAGVGSGSAATPNTLRGALEQAYDDSINDR